MFECYPSYKEALAAYGLVNDKYLTIKRVMKRNGHDCDCLGIHWQIVLSEERKGESNDK